jgi:hypothetical protein
MIDGGAPTVAAVPTLPISPSPSRRGLIVSSLLLDENDLDVLDIGVCWDMIFREIVVHDPVEPTMRAVTASNGSPIASAPICVRMV